MLSNHATETELVHWFIFHVSRPGVVVFQNERLTSPWISRSEYPDESGPIGLGLLAFALSFDMSH